MNLNYLNHRRLRHVCKLGSYADGPIARFTLQRDGMTQDTEMIIVRQLVGVEEKLGTTPNRYRQTRFIKQNWLEDYLGKGGPVIVNPPIEGYTKELKAAAIAEMKATHVHGTL